MVPNAILIPSLAAFTVTIYIYRRCSSEQGSVSGAKGRGRECLCVHMCVRTPTHLGEETKQPPRKEEDQMRSRGRRERTEKRYCVSRRTQDRGVIIYICRTARAPRAIRRHVDARARRLSADDMNLIYKL
jgi:hypothetical protein